MGSIRVLPLGPPGAGKGTQSRRIAEQYDVSHVSTGDMLRANKDMETDHGSPGEYMDAGELVPDPVMKAVVEEAIADLDGFVLDGYPRTRDQATHLESVTRLHAILYLAVGQEELIRRLSGRRVDPETGRNYHVEFDMPDDQAVRDRLVQRTDDKPEQVSRRLEEYAEKTQPVIDHYRDHEAFVEINGEQDPDAVWADIRAALDTVD